MDNAANLPGLKPVFDTQETSNLLQSPVIALQPTSSKEADKQLDEWLDAARKRGENEFADHVGNNASLKGFLSAVFELSPFLCSLAKKYPVVLALCWKEGFEPALESALAEIENQSFHYNDEATLCSKLRIAKNQSALICGLADLGGWWSWKTVSAAITRTADSALAAATRHLLAEAGKAGQLELGDLQFPDRGSGYSVLAMGKHGAGELNYSSDIDLIIFFDPDAPAILDPDESVKLFVRMTRSLVRIMQERTADGYVFRMDLRLRPDPGSMPLAIPLPVALNYYESRGQNWERAALIKARPVAGDPDIGRQFLNELGPFIWRRYLDYAAIADVHSIKRQIQNHRGYNDVHVPGHNVKLGRGGIREIEFFVQTQQLIAGGRNPILRERRTVEMLHLLVEQNWIEQDTADDLASSYAFLRDLEHRLQIVADAQTHTLPEERGELKAIAHLCGQTNMKAFEKMVVAHLANVESHYAALFAAEDLLSTEQGNLSFTGDDDDPGTVDNLLSMGFENPSRAISVVRGWHFGRHPAVQSQQAREQLTELTPALLMEFCETRQADETLLNFDEFLKGLPSGIQLFSVLKANPRLLTLLSWVLSAAPRLARIITRRPHVFDGVLEPGFFEVAPSVELWQETLQRSLVQARDYEDGLDRFRIFSAEQKFLIGIRLISGAINPHQAAESFSQLAELLLLRMVDWVGSAFKDRHGEVQGAEFALVALGNLGTYELTAGSDLDIMLIYRYDPDQDESDGSVPLHASQYFGRFAQRLIAAMKAPTAQGIVYELDFRLRPHGSAGPIATSLQAFQQHFEEGAWTWERLAMARARVLGGESSFREELEIALNKAVSPDGSKAKMAKDILKMRLLMDKERPAREVWDVKLAEGGLVDIEFLAQTEILFGNLEKQRTIGDGLQSLSEQKLQNDNVTLLKAHGNFIRVIQVLRLCLDSEVPTREGPRGMIELLLQQLDLPDMKSAEAYLKDSQTVVRQIFVERLEAYAAQS